MLETAFGGTTKPSVLLLFQPRQVTLANMKNKKNSSSETLEKDIPDTTIVQKLSQKEKKKKKRISKDSSALLLSIANFLELKGFSKTLAAFKSEALIEQVNLIIVYVFMLFCFMFLFFLFLFLHCSNYIVQNFWVNIRFS